MYVPINIKMGTNVSNLISKSRININEILTRVNGHNSVINGIPNYISISINLPLCLT